MLNLWRINNFFVIYVGDTQLTSRLYNWQSSGVYLLQNDFSSYGIDWDGPVPAPSPDSVEVPETRCPINPERIESMSPLYPPPPRKCTSRLCYRIIKCTTFFIATLVRQVFRSSSVMLPYSKVPNQILSQLKEFIWAIFRFWNPRNARGNVFALIKFPFRICHFFHCMKGGLNIYLFHSAHFQPFVNAYCPRC